MHAFRVEIRPVDPGALGGPQAIKHVNAGGGVNASGFIPNQETPTNTTIRATDAQIQGLMCYIAMIADGTNTGAVETAIAGIV